MIWEVAFVAAVVLAALLGAWGLAKLAFLFLHSGCDCEDGS